MCSGVVVALPVGGGRGLLLVAEDAGGEHHGQVGHRHLVPRRAARDPLQLAHHVAERGDVGVGHPREDGEHGADTHLPVVPQRHGHLPQLL